MRCNVAASPLVKVFLGCLLISFVIPGSSPVFAQTGQAQPQQNPAPKGQVKTYLHPIRKFTAAIPVGAEVSERGKAVQVSIRSRRGYIINLQTGDANPALSLAHMIAKLESKYLGEGKPWSQKLGGQASQLTGLSAVEALYEGAGTRVKVVVARGVKTDFVIIFFAPVESFENLEHEFNWFLSNFSPNPADLTGEKRAAALPAAKAAVP